MNKVLILLKKAGVSKAYWRFRNGVSFLRTYAQAFSLIASEMFSAVSYWRFAQNEKDILAIRIRKRAHQVERIIMLDVIYAGRRKVSDFLAGELDSFIAEWRTRYEERDFVRFAERISREYKELFLKDKKCPMLDNGGVSGGGLERATFEELYKSRRSIRVFLKESVKNEHIQKLVEAAKWAPSSCNCQALKFIFVKNPDFIKIISYSMTEGGNFSRFAPILLLVLADRRAYRFPEDRFTPFQDSAAAIQNLLLEAASLGLGACWCSYVSCSNIKKESRIRELLNIPGYMLICGAVSIGIPAQRPCPQPRLENNQLYSIDRYKDED